MSELQWHPQALIDRQVFFTQIAEQSANDACLWDQDLDTKLQQAAANPSMLLPGRVSGTLEYVLLPHYVAVLKVTENNSVVVLRLLHALKCEPAD